MSEQGKVKWYNEDKGFGFITRDDGSDIFVHRSEISGGALGEGEAVEFEVADGEKGPCAVGVKRV